MADDNNWSAQVPTGAQAAAQQQVIKLRGGGDGGDRFRIYTKNVMSLTDARLEELLCELEDEAWDVVLLTETCGFVGVVVGCGWCWLWVLVARFASVCVFLQAG